MNQKCSKMGKSTNSKQQYDCLHHPKAYLMLFSIMLFLSNTSKSSAENSNLFREYIGALYNGVKFTDVPINSANQFHFILSFAIDYTTSSSPSPTNGKFNIFWDSDTLTPQQVSSIKSRYPNVRVALSLGGDSVRGQSAYFQPTSIDSWVSNAVSSLTKIINQYHLDGIDIDYEHFKSDDQTFMECIGRLITTLKNNRAIKLASIAPFDDPQVQSHYLSLWGKYANVIDYVNFQFYAYDSSTTVDQFIQYFETQQSNYKGGKILASFLTDGSGGLAPGSGFFTACQNLKNQQKLVGIFAWCADSSMALDFKYEKQSQNRPWWPNFCWVRCFPRLEMYLVILHFHFGCLKLICLEKLTCWPNCCQEPPRLEAGH